MALPTIQDLENLFPQLANQARGLANKSSKGRKFTERELGDAISALLTKTKSVNSSRVRQTAAAAGDQELLAQTEALEQLIQGGVLDRMEEFLKGDLKAGQTDDLIDQFNALNDVITNVTEQSPIAISRMIRAQVSTLRSGKTTATRKATAVQNFQKISGKELTTKDLEELIAAIEDGTEDVDSLVQQMEETANDNDRMAQADEELTMSLRDLINGVESGLIETDALATAVSDLVPTLEDSSLASSEIAARLADDPSLEVLKDLLAEVEGQDIGNIDKEKRKALNLGEDGSFGSKVSNLTPDVVKATAETGKGFLFDLIKGGAILALLGSTGLLTTIGKIIFRVGAIALNYIKETVAPEIEKALGAIADFAIDKVNAIGGFGGTQKAKVGNIVDFFADIMLTKLTVIADSFGLAFRKAISSIPGFGSELEIRSAFADARQEAIQTGQYVVYRDPDGRNHLIDFDGVVKLKNISNEEAFRQIKDEFAIDRRVPELSGNFGGEFEDFNDKRRLASQKALRQQVTGFLSFDDPKVTSILITKDQSAALQEAERNSQGVVINRGGRAGATGRETAPNAFQQGFTGPGVGRRKINKPQSLAPSVSPLGEDTKSLNVGPGVQ